MNTSRVLISLAANSGGSLYQFNFNALLHGNLEEEVYIKGPCRFDESFKAIGYAS